MEQIQAGKCFALFLHLFLVAQIGVEKSGTVVYKLVGGNFKERERTFNAYRGFTNGYKTAITMYPIRPHEEGTKITT